MKRLETTDILPLDAFTAERSTHQAEVRKAKAVRRLGLGDHLTFLFENRVTIRWQIHEMCRVESIRDPRAVAHELESYNPLIPGESELSSTLLVEYAEEDERTTMLGKLLGLSRHIRLEIEGVEPVPGVFEEGREDEERQRISAVHFVRFPLDGGQRSAFADLTKDAAFVVDHPAYAARATVPGPVRGALVEDLLAD